MAGRFPRRKQGRGHGARAEGATDFGGERNVPLPVAFRTPHDIAAEGAPDRQEAGLPVDVRPVERAQFAKAQAGSQSEQDHFAPDSLAVVEQGSALFRREEIEFLGRDFKPLDQGNICQPQPLFRGL